MKRLTMAIECPDDNYMKLAVNIDGLEETDARLVCDVISSMNKIEASYAEIQGECFIVRCWDNKHGFAYLEGRTKEEVSKELSAAGLIEPGEAQAEEIGRFLDSEEKEYFDDRCDAGLIITRHSITK